MAPIPWDPAWKLPFPRAHLCSACQVPGPQSREPIAPPGNVIAQALAAWPSFLLPWGPPPPQHSPGAAYGAVGRTGAHFVPSGAPAHLEDAASASVAVNEIPTLQSKVITP